MTIPSSPGLRRLLLTKRNCVCTFLRRRLAKFFENYAENLLLLGILLAVSTAAAVQITYCRIKTTVLQRHSFEFGKHVPSIVDEIFKRLYGLTARKFTILFYRLTTILSRRFCRRADRNATISIEYMLYVTLRISAGATYLIFECPYVIGSSTAYLVFSQTINALNSCLDPISFRQLETKFREEAARFNRNRSSSLCGVVAA